MLLPKPSADLFRAPYDEFCEAAPRYLAEVDPEELGRRIEPDDLSEMRWHPGKFMVAHLTPFGARLEGQLRIHIWPSGVDRNDSDIHTHSFLLASKILTGTYAECLPTVREAEPGEETGLVRYDVSHEPGNPDLIYTSSGTPVIVDKGEIVTYGPGEVHKLASDVFHQTPVSGTEPLVTLALMSSDRHESHYLRPTEDVVAALQPPRGVVGGADQLRAYDIIHSTIGLDRLM